MRVTLKLQYSGEIRLEHGTEQQKLTSKEMALLLALKGRRGSLMTKEALLQELYGGRDEPELKIIDVFVCKLRKKLDRLGAKDAISTVWGKGYHLNSKAYEVETPGGFYVSTEVSADTNRRLEDLAIATDATVEGLLNRIINSAMPVLEKEVWE